MYTLSALGRTGASDGPMVARAAELERVLTALDNVCALGRGHVVLLAGEPGIGKTRLAREALAAVRARGVQVFSGRCFEQHTAVPLFPFTEVFEATLAEASPELRAELRSRWPELAHIVPDLGARPRKKGQDTQLQVFRAATAFLHEFAAVKPIFVMLDDLHWADNTSLDLLLYIARHLHDTRALILGTYRQPDVSRNHPLESILRELVRERLLEEIHLDRLSSAGTAELIGSRFTGDVASEQVVALVHERAQGNPFFTEELLAALTDVGGLSRQDSDWQTAVFADLRVPRSIRTVIGDRVRRLPPEGQNVLTVASMLGQEFDLDLLLAVGERTEREISNGLDAALGAGLLQESRTGYGERHAFAHALIQQTLYEEVPAHRRRRLHLRIGEVMEGLHNHPRNASAELVRHFIQGGNTVRAAAHAIQAGDDAAGSSAHAEAAHYYALAVDVLRGSGERARVAEVQCRLAAELLDLNRLQDASAAYETAMATFQALCDHMGQALAQWGLGRLHLGRYDMVTAAHHLDAALGLWPSGHNEADLVRVMVDGVRAKVFNDDTAAAIELADNAVRLGERVGDAGLIARALVGAAEAHMTDKSDRDLILVLDRAERFGREVNDWRTLSRVYVNRAVKHINVGDLDNALADNRLAVESADRSGETERLRFAYQALSFTCVPVGAWEEGRDAARAGLDLIREEHFNGIAGPAMLAWMEGRYYNALTHLRRFWTEAREKGDRQGVADATACLADFTLQLGRPADAEAPARESAEVTRSSWPHTAGDVAILAETLACLNAADADAVLSAAEQRVAELQKAVAQPQLLRAKGRLLLQRGDPRRAQEVLKASAAVARSQHARVQLARTLAALADAARVQGDESLAAEADAERAAIVDWIGPEARGLVWAGNFGSSRHRSQKHPGPAPMQPETPLSPREREVASLLAEGLTDRQIAERLVITEGTAGVHVGHILNKLGFHSRNQIASWAIQYGLGANRDTLRTSHDI